MVGCKPAPMSANTASSHCFAAGFGLCHVYQSVVGQTRGRLGVKCWGEECLLLVWFGVEAGPSSKAAGGDHLQALPQQSLCAVNKAETCQIHAIQYLQIHAHITLLSLLPVIGVHISLECVCMVPLAPQLPQLCSVPVSGDRDDEINFLWCLHTPYCAP